MCGLKSKEREEMKKFRVTTVTIPRGAFSRHNCSTYARKSDLRACTLLKEHFVRRCVEGKDAESAV
jgi:hypothetical protein